MPILVALDASQLAELASLAAEGPGERVLVALEGVELLAGPDAPGRGRLLVTSERLAWMAADGAQGRAAPLTRVGMHAVCRDESYTDRACVYCQLEAGEECVEVKLVPEEEEDVAALFKALSEGVALCPVEEDEDEDGGLAGVAFEGLDSGAQTAASGELTEEEREVLLAQWDAKLTVVAGQFEDAAEEPAAMQFQEDQVQE